MGHPSTKMEDLAQPLHRKPAEIEYWFDFASTYSYPAALRIEQIAAASNAIVLWRPFLLGPIFSAQGWNDSPFNIYAAKGRYMWRDMERFCARNELEFQQPSEFPRNGLLAARIVCAFEGKAWISEFVRRMFLANFALDLDIGNDAIVTTCLELLEQHPKSIIADAKSERIKQKLRARTEQAIELGIFGAPSFVCRGELFWGNERLEDAIAWATDIFV